jgi:undecaprenyl-diphosphatase
MDWSLFHAINGLGRHDDSLQDTAVAYNAVALFAIVAVAGFLWFLARPNGPLKAKLAAASAAFSVGLGLLLNVVAGSLWHHDRPFVDHPRGVVLLVHHVADNSFPSDHSTVAFAAAFAVLVSAGSFCGARSALRSHACWWACTTRSMSPPAR